MKVYARKQRVKINYGNVLVVCNFKQNMEQTIWKQKGLIQETTIELAKYIEMKKELKAKGLI